MSYVEYEKKYVATYKELVITFLAFCIILFVLYPKDLLKDQILSESSNYDLSMLYLENMLDNDPTNEALMLGLAQQSLRSGKRDLSLRLLKLLDNSKDAQMKKKAFILTYTLLKENYFFFDDEAKKKEQMKKLRLAYENVMNSILHSEYDVDTWYTEAIFIKNDEWAYYFLEKKMANEPENIANTTQAYYLAIKLNKTKRATTHIHTLQKIDEDNRDEWILAEYYDLMEKKKYMQAEMLLKKYSRSSIEFKEELALFYSDRGAYIKSSKIYHDLRSDVNNYTDKKIYLLKSLDALQAGSYKNRAVALASRYENSYLSDREVRSYILKLYLATSELDKASKLAAKILKKR